jgi:catechol 2,3-dioxygenase-like lactoylglutathione lyase family enzyme
MNLHFDHVALVVSDLDVAITNFTSLGFSVVRGGAHPTGSQVAFMSFDDGTSLELFSFQTPAAAAGHRYGDALRKGEGLADWCVTSAAVERDVARARAIGVTIDDPVRKSRLRPDGRELFWRIAITGGASRSVVPFILEDETPRADRVPAPGRHPNGCRGIAGFVLLVPDLELPRKWCERVAGTAVTTEGGGIHATLGGVRVTWMAPEIGSDAARVLATRGLAPYELQLRASAGANAGGSILEPARTHGARLMMI